ncbi:MAG: lipopolysaccharide transport periplasmic protein LptA [Sulfuricurvum sp.]|jgi:lipopolysaccharide export system protein LptA|uniref:lipopolysaccharide transport periplasmic protein LptA n=1 Tax=Sulfuricurvum sp. TaxID=2025608 RepID=UPI002627C0E1|nr:lipopolysaccharide transport periplasmic protein LptA [Sulfuricurvum sp.]MDD2829508.1 lipopolysaccharide transport periplasmic protein LptA [Sulfuricurvum sp.]MDD4949495.1 lipopolysaccharide transport periplasmic protein LptA [Sulfuricurvum sp.]
MYKRLIFFLLFSALSMSANELKVLSDNFKGDQPKGLSVFTGNVKVTKGLDELNASKVTIYTDASRKPTKYIAEGDVSFYIVTENNEKYRGKSQRAVYLPNESEYQFYTKVDLIRIDDYRRVKGDKVVVNEVHGFANADSVDGEPVLMIFTMQDKNATKKGSSK